MLQDGIECDTFMEQWSTINEAFFYIIQNHVQNISFILETVINAMNELIVFLNHSLCNGETQNKAMLKR